MTTGTVKLGIIEKILPLDSMEVLLEIQSLIDKTLKGKSASFGNKPKKQTFEEWNLQFQDEEEYQS